MRAMSALPAIHNGPRIGHEAPHELRQRAAFGLHGEDAFRVVDGAFNFATVADNARIWLQEAAYIFFGLQAEGEPVRAVLYGVVQPELRNASSERLAAAD